MPLEILEGYIRSTHIINTFRWIKSLHKLPREEFLKDGVHVLVGIMLLFWHWHRRSWWRSVCGAVLLSPNGFPCPTRVEIGTHLVTLIV
jgi:hypothetical protein